MSYRDDKGRWKGSPAYLGGSAEPPANLPPAMAKRLRAARSGKGAQSPMRVRKPVPANRQ